MSKIHIEIPEAYIFSTTVDVRITDMNYGGHLGNDALLTLLHEARIRFLSHFGYSEKHIDQVGLIMADVAIQYKAEVFYGQSLNINIALRDFTRVAFDIIYVVYSESRLVAIAKTGLVCYDYTLKKITSVPTSFQNTMLSAKAI